MNIKYKEDYELVHRYLSGDRDAGERLYANVYPFVLAMIKKYGATKEFTIDEIQDVAQDTFKESINKLTLYNGTSKFSTFVIGIAKRKIEEMAKYKKKACQREVELPETNIIKGIFDTEENFYTKNPLNIILEREIREEVEEVFSQLKGDYQMIIRLRCRGMRTREIAEITGKTEDAIESLYRRAIMSFRDKWKTYKNF